MQLQRSRVFLLGIGVLLTLGGCTPAPKGTDSTATQASSPWPTDHGVPVNQWYLGTKDADGGRTRHYVVEYGTQTQPEKTVIALHGGWGAEHSYLIPLLRPLAKDYRFVLYDQRGSLRTPIRPPATVSFSALVDDLEQLRKSLGLEKVTLLAHSMGNHLAYGYLRAHPDRVAKLILVGPVYPAVWGDARPAFLRDVWPDFSERDAAAISQAGKDYELGYMRRVMRRFADAGLIPAATADAAQTEPGEKVAALYAEAEKRFDEDASTTSQQRTNFWRIQFACINSDDCSNWRHMLGGMVFYNDQVATDILKNKDFAPAVEGFWPALKAFKGPVRVIIGSQDYVDLGPTYWPRLVAALPNAHLDVIPDAGHSSWMDKPELVEQALSAALAIPPAAGN